MTFSFHHKILYSFGFVLFGVLFFLTPIKANAYNYSVVNNGRLCQFSGTTPFSFNGTTGGIVWDSTKSFNLNIDAPYHDYGNLEFSSFDLNVSLGFSLRGGYSHNINLTGTYFCDIYVNYNDYTGSAQSMLVSNASIGLNISTTDMSQVNDFIFPVTIPGTPTGARVVLNIPDSYYGIRVTMVTGSNSQILDDLDYVFTASITNFTDNPDSGGSSGGGSGASTASRLLQAVPVGYSNLNFGLNGDIYFLSSIYNNIIDSNSVIFPSVYLNPVSFYFNNLDNQFPASHGVYATLGMGDVTFDSPVTGSPISIIGDTRPGDYCISIGISSDEILSDARLNFLLDHFRYTFEFNLGWTGQQFGLPDDATISYCYFQDSQSGLYYLNLYVFFTTSELFDSFLIRHTPILSTHVIEASFNFSKYTGTINDQLNKMDDQWNANIPNHNSFSNSNSNAQSSLNSMSQIESQSFDRLDTSIQATGIDSFNLNVVSAPMATVSAMITRIYNILPDSLKFVILSVLTLGIFAVIIRAGSYAGGKNGG